MSRIVIDENKCKGCALCTTVCPFDLIHIADRFNAKGYRPAEYSESRPRLHDNLAQDNRCTGCANCAAMCPDVAITVYRTRSGARADKLVPLKTGSPAEHPHSKGNGRERQTLQAEPHPPTAPERR